MPVLLLAASDADPRALAGLEQGAAEFVILPGLAEGAEREAAARDVAALIREVAARGARALHGGPRPRRLPTAPPMRRAGRAPRLVVVGASTGGPRAVQSLLEALPGTLNAALVVALHMPARFTSLYAERLARVCRLAVREAADGERLAAGGAVVIPGGRQAELFRLGERLHLRLRARGAGEVHAPSVDRVMRSAAAAAGAAAVGIVLTGMGDDGAQGLLAIRAAGGATIAESDRTALIFGMPGEAIRAGAAGAVLPLDEIPAALLERCGVRAPEEPGDD
jgi:two-component system chemotaxis response regulator CheB